MTSAPILARVASLALIAATPALADETRSAEAHVHGVGALNIAIDGNEVAMEFHTPGADIVGFEHAATTDLDKAAILTGLAQLERPETLFALPQAAGCTVSMAKAALEAEDDHDQHGHDEHGHDDHADDDHDHADHAADKDDHDHAHGHDEHGDHDDHAHEAESSHSEFHAEYLLTCADADQITEIAFPYFQTFANAKELKIQLVTDHGAHGHSVTAAAPVLKLDAHH